MIRKIIAHGDPVLKQEGEWVEKDHKGLKELISDMFETMERANGIGLAAQQIGLPLKIFVVDLSYHGDEDESLKNYKKVFINSEIHEESEEQVGFEEGCLSFPGIHFNVDRPKRVKVFYQDENFVEHTEWLEGIKAVVFQHEHDHTEGIVFTDHASPLKKSLMKSKLKKISKGEFVPRFPMKFYKKK